MVSHAKVRNIFCNQGVTGSSPVAGTNRNKHCGLQLDDGTEAAPFEALPKELRSWLRRR